MLSVSKAEPKSQDFTREKNRRLLTVLLNGIKEGGETERKRGGGKETNKGREGGTERRQAGRHWVIYYYELMGRGHYPFLCVCDAD